MFNLSPQRATDPKDLYKKPPKGMFQKNRQLIIEQYHNYKIRNTWIAWGNLINSRNYFKKELIAIYNTQIVSEKNWKAISLLNKSGHPKHPLYQPANSYLTDFEIQKYINKL
jgi:serine/threonine protein phosphatase 1